jgi:AraC family transcriptional activator of pobA
MDGARSNLYFSDMRPSPATNRRSPAGTVPAYFLYGEPLQAPDERAVHVETIAARSRLHDWVIQPHRHRDLHQVLLIERGRAEIRLDGRDASLRAPGAIVVPPKAVHSFRFQPDSVGLVVSFAPGLARDVTSAAPGLLPFLEQPAALAFERHEFEATDLWALGTMLLREFGRSARGRHVALRGLVGALLANLVRLAREVTSPERATPPRDHELVARFRELVERRFREHPTLIEYVAELRTSEARLRRACLAVTGQPPIELVHSRVLVEAERQLRYTSMPVTQVAYYLGFDDPAYFTRFFRRRMGLSPRAFRVRDGFERHEQG